LFEPTCSCADGESGWRADYRLRGGVDSTWGVKLQLVTSGQVPDPLLSGG
jgi:hypothetical protein